MSGDLLAELDGVSVVTAGRLVSQPNEALAEFRGWALPLVTAADVDETDRELLFKLVFKARARADLPRWARRLLERTATRVGMTS